MAAMTADQAAAAVRRHHDLIYDWAPPRSDTPEQQRIAVHDETLRDGLQSPSVTNPPLASKIEILHAIDGLGIDSADLGLPGAGPRHCRSVAALCREITDHRLRVKPCCAGRTVEADIRPIVELSQATGLAIEAGLFIGSSPIRLDTEGWDLDHVLRCTIDAIGFAVREGLEVLYVTEDTARSAPAHLRVLLTAAIDAGADRVGLCDTVGAAIPAGVTKLVSWVGELLDELGVTVGIDWHGHCDRGLGLANTLAAVDAGATRVHGTALGIGERTGNAAMEQILVNLKLLGRRDDDLSQLREYVEVVARALGMPLPANAPIVGRDAFRTATGVHAAAVVKALDKGDSWLAEHVYSGVPAGWVHSRQEIEIGAMSGLSNVRHYLASRGLPAGEAIELAVLAKAKASTRLLTEDEVLKVVRRFAGTTSP